MVPRAQLLMFMFFWPGWLCARCKLAFATRPSMYSSSSILMNWMHFNVDFGEFEVVYGPCVILFLIEHPYPYIFIYTFEWSMTRLVVKNGHQRDTCHDVCSKLKIHHFMVQ